MLMVAVGSQNSNLIYKRSVVSQVTRQVAMLWPAITQHGKILAVTMILDKPGLLYRSCAYCSNISRNSCIQTSSDRTANLNVMYNISLRIPICIGPGSFAWGHVQVMSMLLKKKKVISTDGWPWIVGMTAFFWFILLLLAFHRGFLLALFSLYEMHYP